MEKTPVQITFAPGNPKRLQPPVWTASDGATRANGTSAENALFHLAIKTGRKTSDFAVVQKS